jgi:nitroimidazol reductase NimA-like FMN-containing flavoprotein (pyridoxamine 5'-phosphate oxidase superfamily)
MGPEEIDEFLDSRTFAAVATISADGAVRVAPARYSRVGDQRTVRLAPSAPGRGSASMANDEVKRFLREFRYPNEHATAPFVAVATRRKDGSALVVPFGYLYQDGCFYMSVNNVRSLRHRIRRNPQIALGIFSDREPLQAVVATGVAEPIEDPGNLVSRNLYRRHMESYPWLDFEAYLSEWLAVGRSLYRVQPHTLIGWTSEHGAPPATLEAADDEPLVSFAAYSDTAPTVVVLLVGHARPNASKEDGRYDLAVERLSAWDSRKQETDRWEKGKGSHVEGGTWITVGER